MGKINVLGFDVANLIAAGEVVDRPASVVKELLENAIDAGARNITVEIQRGGTSFIRVSDNGCGIGYDDLPLAILRHATSKISGAEDLDHIATLGFRGEALAATAAVSRMRILSKPADAPMGALLEAMGGENLTVSETGCADGTTVIVEDLFFNVPARRKFLKKDSTETVAVSGVVEKIALSVPDVALKYITDGEMKFMTAGDGKLEGVIYALYGRDVARRVLRVDRTDNGIRVSGFISEADFIRSNRNMENFFVNGRFVRSRTAMAAVEQAYVSKMQADKFPFCVLNIELNPATVDVNVHPSKLEVKFSNERIIFDSVYYTVLSALEASASRPELSFNGQTKPTVQATLPQNVAEPYRRPSAPPAQNAEALQRLLHPFVPVEGRSEYGTRPRDQVRLDAAGQAKEALPQPQQVPPRVSLTAAVPCEAFPASPALPAGAAQSADSGGVKATVCGREMGALPSPKPGTACNTDPPAAAGAAACSSAPENPPAVFENRASRTLPDAARQTAEPDEKSGQQKTDASPAIPPYLILGEAYNCYVILQLEDRLLIVDKHAAHERILFERLCRNMREREKHPQILMFPLEITLTEPELDALSGYDEQVRALGFGLKTADGKLYMTEIPEELSREQAEDVLVTLAGRLAEGSGNFTSAGAEFFERTLWQAACKAAIKGGRVYGQEHIRFICDQILQAPDKGGSVIKTCPHGRPVAFEIKKSSIERQFARLQ